MEVSPAQVLAFRLAAQRLAPRGDGGEPLAPLTSWALQDSPPGTAAVALAARTEPLDPGALDAALHDERSAVALYNPRTATAVVPAAEVVAYTAALRPTDADGWRVVLGRALPADGELAEPTAALAVGLPAVAEALDDGELSRDDLHAALRERLPRPLLPWCDGCQSHHARRGLLVAAGLHGLLCIAGKAGRQPLFARTDQWLGTPPGASAQPAEAAASRRPRRPRPPVPARLRALHACAAARSGRGSCPSQARAAWALVEPELVEVSVASDGGETAVARGCSPTTCRRSRPPRRRPASCCSRPATRCCSRATASCCCPIPCSADAPSPRSTRPATSSSTARPIALWRGRKSGRTLQVAVEPLAERPLPRRALGAIEREATRLAPHRGCAVAALA